MKYERHQVQEYFEQKIGCTDRERYKDYKVSFLDIALDQNDINVLNSLSLLDSVSNYQKGFQSLCEGIIGVYNNCYSWATVKLYYSLFYFLRSTTISYNYIFVRWVNIYYFKLLRGEKASNSHISPRNKSNDHAFTIDFYEKIVGYHDILCTNKIDGVNAYDWFKALLSQESDLVAL